MDKDPLFNYRQPLVTAAGIILGFVLNFATDMVKLNKRNDMVAILILAGIFLGIMCMLIALYRILNHRYSHAKAAAYYQRTLRLFISGVVLSFFGGLVKMVQTLWS